MDRPSFASISNLQSIYKVANPLNGVLDQNSGNKVELSKPKNLR